MKKFNRKAQMMDAGTALFESKDGYGTVLGQVKAELKEFGSVTTPDDFPAEAMPESTAEYDLFLDYSTPWRKRYISCRLEDAGNTGKETEIGEPIRRYAVTLKEGNTTTVLRTLVYLSIMLGFTAAIFISGHFILTLLDIALAVLTLYLWMVPSRFAQKSVRHLLDRMSHLGKQ